jgi:hypothetical protein
MKMKIQIVRIPLIYPIYRLYRIILKYSKKFINNRKIYPEYLLNNEKLIHLKQSDKLCILGNGPSLKHVDFSLLKEYDLYVCNYFYRHKIFESLDNIIAYFSLDGISVFLKQEAFGLGRVFNLVVDYHADFLSNKYISIVNVSIYNYFVKNNIFRDKKLLYSHPTSSLFLRKFARQMKEQGYSIDEALKVRHTPMFMIQAGLMAGYKTIYLYGLEHSYVRDTLNRQLVGGHFYSETQAEVIKNNLGSEDVIGPLSGLFMDSGLTFRVYEHLAVLAKIMGVRIIDKTTDGCLNMFEKE